MELRLDTVDGLVRLHLDKPCPAGVLEFTEALTALVTPGHHTSGRALDIHVRSVTDGDREWARVTQDLQPPTSGVLTRLPPHPSVRVMESPGPGEVALRWRGAGIVTGAKGSGEIAVLAEDGGPDLSWLLRYLFATPLALWGAIDVCHGSLVRWQGKHILFTGPARSGKSSLSLLFALRGGELLTDDITYLDVQGRAAPAPIRDFLTLREGTYQAFSMELSRRYGAAALAARRAALPLSALRGPVGQREPVPVDFVVFPSLTAEPGVIRARFLTEPSDLNRRCFERDYVSMINWLGLFMPGGGSYRRTGRLAAECRACDLEVSLDYPAVFGELVNALFMGAPAISA
ncbi:MAG: hypothetical protein ACLQDY_05215 [Streptosporangiaceae bacterium]